LHDGACRVGVRVLDVEAGVAEATDEAVARVRVVEDPPGELRERARSSARGTTRSRSGCFMSRRMLRAWRRRCPVNRSTSTGRPGKWSSIEVPPNSSACRTSYGS
jgi:hypothetical protein